MNFTKNFTELGIDNEAFKELIDVIINHLQDRGYLDKPQNKPKRYPVQISYSESQCVNDTSHGETWGVVALCNDKTMWFKGWSGNEQRWFKWTQLDPIPHPEDEE